MAVEFITTRIEVPRGTGRRQLNGSVPFQRKVRVANIALRGFLLDFVNSDHHINVVEVSTNLGVIEGEIVHFGWTASTPTGTSTTNFSVTSMCSSSPTC